MRRIYTKTGDEGMTSLRGGVRVPKDDIRIETNGALDELNATIGIVRTMLQADHQWQALLEDIQSELMIVMSHVATPEGRENPKTLHAPELTMRIEEAIDSMRPQTSGFVLPGGTPLAAHLHLARTVARRAERRLWSLHKVYPQDMGVMRFVNRLSDLLFVMATS